MALSACTAQQEADSGISLPSLALALGPRFALGG